jgi:hypothetical protein
MASYEQYFAEAVSARLQTIGVLRVCHCCSKSGPEIDEAVREVIEEQCKRFGIELMPKTEILDRGDDVEVEK